METINPWEVCFSQASIRFTFADGTTLDDLAAALRSGKLDPARVPPIRLVRREKQIFTLDNRRLEAFRRAGLPVPCRSATAREVAAASWKFTSSNGGVSVRVRREPSR